MLYGDMRFSIEELLGIFGEGAYDSTHPIPSGPWNIVTSGFEPIF
jgi:hypothetical protein